MPTKATIYFEADVDVDELMEALDGFIHDRGWCGCVEGQSIAVWSARHVDEGQE